MFGPGSNDGYTQLSLRLEVCRRLVHVRQGRVFNFVTCLVLWWTTWLGLSSSQHAEVTRDLVFLKWAVEETWCQIHREEEKNNNCKAEMFEVWCSDSPLTKIFDLGPVHFGLMSLKKALYKHCKNVIIVWEINPHKFDIFIFLSWSYQFYFVVFVKFWPKK